MVLKCVFLLYTYQYGLCCDIQFKLHTLFTRLFVQRNIFICSMLFICKQTVNDFFERWERNIILHKNIQLN